MHRVFDEHLTRDLNCLCNVYYVRICNILSNANVLQYEKPQS